MQPKINSKAKILVIRRDHIGDLVCTTPIFRALRTHFPEATLCALVNSYNQDVLENNPDVDQIFVYTKARRRLDDQSIFKVYWSRLLLLLQLRRISFDFALLANAGFAGQALSLARFIKPKHIIGFVEPGSSPPSSLDIPVSHASSQPLHEVEDVFRLLLPFGIHESPSDLCVVPCEKEIANAKNLVEEQRWPPSPFLIGVHISSRKVSQRWPAIQFIRLIKQLHETYGASFLLFWSPGESTHPLHPGDDVKAREIMAKLQNIPILAFPTQSVRELIGGLSVCQGVICSDGGAMHLAAGLGKPILCFFGKSDRTHWHPWKVPYVLLQPPSTEVSDITVEEASYGFRTLLEKTGLLQLIEKT